MSYFCMVSRRVRFIFALAIFCAAAPLASRAEVSLSLSEAISLSRQHSYAIRSLYHDSLSARYDLAAARSLRYPALSATAVSSYTDGVQAIELPFTRIELGSHENYQADLRLTFPLYSGGRISSQIKLQSAIATSRGFNLEAEIFQTAYETRKAYLGLMITRSLLAAAEASLRRIEILNRDVQNLYRGGLADSIDILDSELALRRAAQARNDRRTGESNAAALLARLTGLPLSENIKLSELLPVPDYEHYENIDILPEKSDRPEMEILKSRAAAARHSIGLNRAALMPALNAFGGYTVGKPNRDLVDKDWNDYWTAGLNLTWEFNLGGRVFKGVSASREAARSAQLTADDLEESLQLAVRIAFENLGQAFGKYSSSQLEFEIAGRKYFLGAEKQKAGGLSVNRLLELEEDLDAAEQVFQSSIINYYLSETEYLYAIGSPKIYGGF